MNGRSNPVRSLITHGLLWLAAFMIFFPLYSIVLSAFKGKAEFAHSNIFEWPHSFLQWDNFEYVLHNGKLFHAFGNTIAITLMSLVGNLFVSTMAAYILGRFRFRGKITILGAFTAVSFIPSITTQVATFTIIQKLGLFNTLFAPVLLYIGTDIIQLYVYLQFIRTVPEELDESAMLEGASLFGIYRAIILPLLAPAIATMVIIKSINIYNDMYIPYLYMPSKELGVVSTSLMRFVADRTTEWQYMSAAVLLIMAPVIVGFLAAQRYVFAGIVAGAVK
ncbi:carbohydrate ABC transporter permease [Cohnella caldifontis]|uniref:carbohydrate ABC transporter permease n=1 Tax=Cohnella caldifontis TaxID=3027471 RepID=UPI0023EBA5BE|nr:carbohydrate ABC transporter permease [Cohnella sp. YIM B05605]